MKETIENKVIPTDYIMTSVELAEEIGRDPVALYKYLQQSDYLCGERMGVYYPTMITINGKDTVLYLLDFEAAMELVQDEGVEIREKVFNKFCELAGNNVNLPRGDYLALAGHIYDKSSKEMRFADRLFRCVHGSRYSTD